MSIKLKHVQFIPFQYLLINTIFYDMNSNFLMFAGQKDECYSSIGLWNLTTNQLEYVIDSKGITTSIFFLSYEKKIFYSSKNIIKIHTITSPQNSLELVHNAIVTSIVYCPIGKTIISGTEDGVITFWQTAAGQKTLTLLGHGNEITSILCTRDEKILISASSDKTIKVWDLVNKKEVFTLKGHKEKIFSLALNPNETILASGGADDNDQIKLWNIKTEQQLCTKFRSDSFLIDTSVTALAFSSIGNYLATSFFRDNYQVGLWDVNTGNNLALGKGFADEVYSILLHPTANIIISCGSGICGAGIDIWEIID